MKWLALSIVIVAAVALVVGLRATAQHHPRRCYTGIAHNIPVDC
jgi:hypothetical protein